MRGSDNGHHALIDGATEVIEVARQANAPGRVLVQAAPLLIFEKAVRRDLRVEHDTGARHSRPVADVRPGVARLVVDVQPVILRVRRFIRPVTKLLVECGAGRAEEEAILLRGVEIERPPKFDAFVRLGTPPW